MFMTASAMREAFSAAKRAVCMASRIASMVASGRSARVLGSLAMCRVTTAS